MRVPLSLSRFLLSAADSGLSDDCMSKRRRRSRVIRPSPIDGSSANLSSIKIFLAIVLCVEKRRPLLRKRRMSSSNGKSLKGSRHGRAASFPSLARRDPKFFVRFRTVACHYKSGRCSGYVITQIGSAASFRPSRARNAFTSAAARSIRVWVTCKQRACPSTPC
jgi:hypothetical protein